MIHRAFHRRGSGTSFAFTSSVSLRCPSCGREVVVAKVDRVLFAQSARCPYPACASVVITVMNWTDETPKVLLTHSEVTRVFRRKLLAEGPAFLFAQAILFMAIYAASYGIDHVRSKAEAESISQSAAHVGIAIGSIGLALPAALATLALIACGYRRVRDDRRMLRHLAMRTGERFRLSPCSRGGYR